MFDVETQKQSQLNTVTVNTISIERTATTKDGK